MPNISIPILSPWAVSRRTNDYPLRRSNEKGTSSFYCVRTVEDDTEDFDRVAISVEKHMAEPSSSSSDSTDDESQFVRLYTPIMWKEDAVCHLLPKSTFTNSVHGRNTERGITKKHGTLVSVFVFANALFSLD